jgi:transcriptional regulator with XRE-family HTH domain
MNIPYKLKQLRMGKEVTQRQLARLLKCGVGVIADIETGRRTPSANVILKLSSFFNTKIEYWTNDTIKIDVLGRKEKYDSFNRVMEKIENIEEFSGELSGEQWELVKKALNYDLGINELLKKL